MPERILVYGVTGSGKSTLARRLADTTGLPWHDVDGLTWRPGWQAVPGDEQRAVIGRICAGDRWILDNAYGYWRDIVLSRADLIVALDYPRWLSLARLVRRTATRVIDKKAICNGNVETLRQAFGQESIIRWHFRSFRRTHERIAGWTTEPTLPPVVRLGSPRDTERWLAGL